MGPPVAGTLVGGKVGSGATVGAAVGGLVGGLVIGLDAREVISPCLQVIFLVLQSVMMLDGQQAGVPSQPEGSGWGAVQGPASRGRHSQSEYWLEADPKMAESIQREDLNESMLVVKEKKMD